MASNISVGDVVVLNSKGAFMTVMAIDPVTGALTTVWTDTVGVSHILGPIPATCFLPAYSALRRKIRKIL